MTYKGTIVEESLKDNRILNNLEIIGVRISNTDKPEDRWHLYKVRVSEDDIETLLKLLKPKLWYMHFWNEDDAIVVFPNKTFQFKHSDKSTWTPAIQFGISIGIPIEKLDFVIE